MNTDYSNSKILINYRSQSACGLVADFMRLCKKLNAAFFATLLAIMLLSQFSMTVAASNLQSTAPSALQTTTVTYEAIQFPNLQTGVELHTHGDSNAFNASHVSTEGIGSHVNLTWTHAAGTELTLTSDELPFTSQRYPFPHYWDFCYFTVSFPWELERMPTDAMFYTAYGVHTTGNFSSTEGELMFNVYSWVIDSSEHWEPLLVSEPPYTTTTQLFSYDLNWFDLSDGWQGMVEDDSGVQDDPEDVLRIGVGLAPSESFESYDDSHPWQDYNGTVTAQVHTVRLEVLLEPEEPNTIPIDLFYLVVAPVGIIVAVAVVYLIWRRYGRARG